MAPPTTPTKEKQVSFTEAPARTAEELHAGISAVHEALTVIYDDLVEFTQTARAADQSVQADDLLRVTNLIAQVNSLAGSLVATPQGSNEETGLSSNTAPVGAPLLDVPPEHNDNQPAAVEPDGVKDDTEA